ncbi:MAG: tetratricopeptide repeat protein, partial [bacterium]
MKNLHTQAISSSLNSDWEIAIELNSLILKDEPNNIAALNRLARAYTELNQKESAKTVYNKVLTLDKYNQIALKNL